MTRPRSKSMARRGAPVFRNRSSDCDKFSILTVSGDAESVPLGFRSGMTCRASTKKQGRSIERPHNKIFEDIYSISPKWLSGPLSFSRNVLRSMPRISAALVLLPPTLAKTFWIYSASNSARVL